MSRRASFRRFIGIDLGGGRGKNTAVSRLELTGDGPQRRLAVTEAKLRYGLRGTGHKSDEPGDEGWFRDDVLIEYLRRWVDDATVVAINAPLTLPPCIRCTLPCPSVERCEVPVVQWMRKWAPKLRMRGRSDPSKPVVTPYTQRAGELLLAADGLRTREALGQGSGPIAARAAYLRRIFGPGLRLHENLLEVHPSATLARIVGPDLERKSRHGPTDGVWNTRKQILASLAEGLAFDYVWPEVVVRNTHVWGAVICAFTAFLWAHESWRGPADLASDPGDEHSHSRRTRLLGEAVRELGERWLEDGWIWIPPPAPSR